MLHAGNDSFSNAWNFGNVLFYPLLKIGIFADSAQLAQIFGHPAGIGSDGHTVIIEND